MNVDRTRLLRFAPFVVPVVVVGIGWAALVRPTAAESARLANELDGLRNRIASVRSSIGAPPPAEPIGDPLKVFERQVAAADASGPLLEELTRLGSSAGVRVETIETADQQTAAFGGGPGVAGSTLPDPRFALFGVPLTYSPVTMTADADYGSLGNFLWRLRDLATVIEVRSLVVAVPPAQNDIPAAPAGSVRATLTMFAYARAASPKPLAEAAR